MKKRFVSVILAALLCLSGTALSSCTGEPGKSAYEIACDNGFIGTEAQWLESLKGDNGKDGVDGKDGKDGVDGKDGISYVESGTSVNVSVDELYYTACQKGYKGTFVDFIAKYITLSSNANEEFAVNRALMSSVSIQCTFYRDEAIEGAEGEPVTIAVPFNNGGAGVIYSLDKESGDAYIITNYHVVYKRLTNTPNYISDEIKVFLYGMNYTESAIEAKYVGGSMTYDIAVLKVSGSDVLKNSDAEAVSFANSNDVTVGQTAIAVGNPFGNGFSATSGIVSVDSEYISIKASDDKTDLSLRSIRIDTPVNSGNSGGGLFNSAGELIGIVNVKETQTSAENVGYAIPSNIVHGVAENIIYFADSDSETDGIKKATLGITMKIENSRSVYDYDSCSAKIYEDCTVDTVNEGSAAYGLIFPGDVITSISSSGKTVKATRLFVVVDFMLDVFPGENVTLHVKRGDGEIDVTIPILEENFTIYD